MSLGIATERREHDFLRLTPVGMTERDCGIGTQAAVGCGGWDRPPAELCGLGVPSQKEDGAGRKRHARLARLRALIPLENVSPVCGDLAPEDRSTIGARGHPRRRT